MTESRRKYLFALALIVAVGCVFCGVARHEFIQYDDQAYVVDNAKVRAGITGDTVLWAFTSFDDGLWAPLTRLSHALDVQAFGMHPGGHHLTSLVLHVINTLLLYVFLTRITGMAGPSALAAACFALHPLRVESVAWVASRKDLLNGLFVLATLLAYDGYVKRPTVWRNALVTAGCACALMAKPMAVTLPFGLMLLDYWPYQRYQGVNALRRLALEKIPMMALVLLVGIITLLAEQPAITPSEYLPLAARIEQALVAGALYGIKTLFPYPLWIPVLPTPEFTSGIRVAGAAAWLLGLSFALGWAGKRGAQGAPCMVGGVWFLGMLVPVIGLVPFGHHIMADRFTYVPHIGLALVLAATLGSLFLRWPAAKTFLSCLVITLLMAYGGLSVQQTRFWRDTGALFRHTLSVDPENYVALCNTGNDLMMHGHPEKALPLFQRVCAMNPGNPDAMNDLGAACLALGRFDEAVQAFSSAVRHKPGDPDVYVNLGAAFLAKGDIAAAKEQAIKALAIKPGAPKAQQLLEQASGKGTSPQGGKQNEIRHF